MKFQIDHDFHIHSFLSSCSNDPKQTPSAILEYAKENGLKNIVLTDHFWDENVPGVSGWYKPQNFSHVSESLPLPQAPDIAFHFGCETEMDRFCNLGISRERMDSFDFIIIPTTHLHMSRFTISEEDMASLEGRARVFVEHFDALLEKDIPFHKIGLAHITCPLLAGSGKTTWADHLTVIDMIEDSDFRRLFTKTAKVGMGVELNLPILRYTEAELPRVMRPYFIARECGCRFYLGSDAHTNAELAVAKAGFEKIIEVLDLKEEDKFDPFKK